MNVIIRLCLSIVLLGAACPVLSAQTNEGVDILLSKARALEARGRMDLAARNWNQVLLVDPNQTEALEGLAQYAKQTGDAPAYRGYLDRLRKINPNNPAIAAIERAHLMTPQELKLLDDAGRLAAEQKPDEAIAVYRRVFGDTPPPTRWGEAFYETLAASTGGREKAVAQLRDRVARNPANDVYRLWLARILTYDPNTRMEGFRLLELIHDAGAIEPARVAWRQALVWEKGNPAALPALEVYVQRYPDRELQDNLVEQNGFKALREKDLTTAQAKFEDLTRRHPNDVNAIVGLGNVRLAQQKFDQSLALFTRARALAPDRADVKDGYESSRFWLVMQRGAAAQTDKPDAAIAAFNEALALRPGNEQALLGAGQAMQRRGHLSGAQTKYEEVLKDSPNNADALAGLAFVRLSQKDFDRAAQLFARARAVESDRRDIDEGYRTATFWRAMQHGAAALNERRPDAAVASYREALAIDAGSKDALLGLADATRLSGKLPEALTVYQQLTAADSSDVRGWLGLMRTSLASRDGKGALQIASTIPASTRKSLEANPEYLALVAQALYRTNQRTAGDQALRTALDASARADSDAAMNARLEIAGLLMEQGNDANAALVYKRVTEAHSDNTTAWEGLIRAYARSQEFASASAALGSMPRIAHDAAMNSASFLKVIAAVYTAEGRCVEAESLLTRSIDLDRAAGRSFSDTQLQLAGVWTLEGRHDRATQGYSDVLTANPQSGDAWRGYIAALHNDKKNYSALAAIDRIPAAVRTDLLKDPDFLRLLASVHSANGNNGRAIELLQQARSSRRALGQPTPIDLDVQLAWAMFDSPKHSAEIPALVTEMRVRSGLTSQQRDALNDINAAWNLRAADQAMRAQDPVRAIAVLTRAVRELPNDSRIRAALASAYVRVREFEKALDVYRSWGMAGGSAADYRAAANTALAADQSITAERFLYEGRQRWPLDIELLHMTALRALARHDYDGAEHYLANALAAARGENPNGASGSSKTAASKSGPSTSSTQGAGTANTAGTAVCCQKAAENTGTSGVPRRAATSVSTTGKTSNDPRFSPQQLEDQLDAVTNRNSPFAGFASPITFRKGDPGVNRLIARDSVASGSVAVYDEFRVGLDVHFVHLDSGTPDGSSGYPFGTLPSYATFGAQSADGLGAEVQASSDWLGAAIGISPNDFLVQNWTGGLRVGTADGSMRLVVSRDNVKDSLLSFAGARDPGTGTVWGGVVSNSAAAQFAASQSTTGQYVSVGGSLLRGEHVADNWGVQGTAGGWWRVLSNAQGELTVGINFTGLHYDRNLNFFSLGHGGYFSPQEYLLGAVPVSWRGRRSGLEYEISGSAGLQSIKEDGAPLDPTQSEELFYASDSRRGTNYSVSCRLEYRASPHWYVQAFAGANNARDYVSQTFQISLKWLLNRVPAGTNLPLKTIPDWKGNRPFTFD